MINPNGSWHTDYYNITKQKTYYQGTLIQGPFTGTVTIDIVVTGGSGTLYFNGQQQGSSGGAPSGLVGLVADTGANVTFNNVAIYA